VAGLLSAVAFFALFGGLLWLLWFVITRSSRRAKQNVTVLNARLAAAAPGPPTPETVVARASSKASLGCSAFVSFLTLACVSDFVRHGHSVLLLAVAFLMAAGALVMLRRAVRRPVQFVASPEGFSSTLGSGSSPGTTWTTSEWSTNRLSTPSNTASSSSYVAIQPRPAPRLRPTGPIQTRLTFRSTGSPHRGRTSRHRSPRSRAARRDSPDKGTWA
jgi:hypothetical protein